MARNAPKTNALGMKLDPDSFEEVVRSERSGAPAEAPVETAQAPANLLAGLKPDKASAKSYAFYLSDENVAKLKALAKKEGVSASKLLDHILSEVLI